MTKTLHYRKLPVLALMMAMLFLGGSALGQTTWIGGATGVWNLATNWSGGAIPGGGDDVIINTSTVIQMTSNVTVNSLTINGDATVVIASNGGSRTLTIDNSTSSIALGSTLELRGAGGGGLNNMILQFLGGGTRVMNIAGTLAVGISPVGDGAEFRTANSNTTVTGTIRTATSTGGLGEVISTATTLNFAAGSKYEHDVIAPETGSIPVATWNANSTIEFSGGGTSSPADLPTTLFGRMVVTNNTTVNIAGTGGVINLRVGDGTGDDLVVDAGSTLNIAGSIDNFAFADNSTALIDGTYATSSPGFSLAAAGVVMTVNGTFRNSGGGAVSGSTTAKLIISPTGTYNQNRNGGTIPTATFNDGSTLLISGVTNTIPTGLGQTFSNFTWNCPGQSALIAFENLIGGITRDLTIASTNNQAVRLANTAADRTLAVGRDFIMTGGEFRIDDNDGGSSMTVGRNMSLSGATQNFIICSGTGTSTVTVAGDVSISGGTAPDGFELSEDVGTGVLNVAGNFSHTAGVVTESAAGSGSIVFNGGVNAVQVYTGGGTITNNVNVTVTNGSTLQMAAASTTISGTGTFTLESGATLGIRSAAGIAAAAATGHILMTGARNYSVGATYLYNGTVAQNTGNGIPAGLTGFLRINNTSGVTLNSAESIGAGGTIQLLQGALATGTNLSFTGVGNIIRSNGSITGTFGGTADYNVTYTGNPVTSGAELQGGQGVSNRLNNLTINLIAAADAVTMSPDPGFETRVKGVLTLTQGILGSTGTNVLEMSDGSTCTTGSANSYVSGPMRKVGSSAFTFPIGGGGLYRPAAVSGSATSIIAGLPSNSEFTAVLALSNPVTSVSPYVLQSPLGSLGVCYFWNITRNDPGTNNIFVWLSTGPGGGAQNLDYIRACINGGTGLPDPAGLRVTRHDGTQWLDLEAGDAEQSNNAWFISANLPSTSFSPFALASSLEQLPVTYTSFTALKDNGTVKLNWETASEQNSDYFDVERSVDGQTYSSIGKVNAAGNSSLSVKYSFTDLNPAAGRNFYRLRQVDLDAKFEYSKTVSVNMINNTAVSIYPNPVQTDVMVEYPKVGRGAIYKVVGMDGRVMISGSLQENSSQQRINLNNLQRGNYILLIQNDGQQYQQKIVKL